MAREAALMKVWIGLGVLIWIIIGAAFSFIWGTLATLTWDYSELIKTDKIPKAGHSSQTEDSIPPLQLAGLDLDVNLADLLNYHKQKFTR